MWDAGISPLESRASPPPNTEKEGQPQVTGRILAKSVRSPQNPLHATSPREPGTHPGTGTGSQTPDSPSLHRSLATTLTRTSTAGPGRERAPLGHIILGNILRSFGNQTESKFSWHLLLLLFSCEQGLNGQSQVFSRARCSGQHPAQGHTSLLGLGRASCRLLGTLASPGAEGSPRSTHARRGAAGPS